VKTEVGTAAARRPRRHGRSRPPRRTGRRRSGIVRPTFRTRG